MALSRERIADELLKLLGVEDPSPTVAVMLDHKILRPVLPEIQESGLPRLRELVAAETQANIRASALRRLAALLPREPDTAERIAVRLKLSNKARKRLACAANPELPGNAHSLTYYLGNECAVDRLLLAGQVADAVSVADWQSPRLEIGGGQLIQRGLKPGPTVARTLQAIERRWVAAGFPRDAELDLIVSEELKSAQS